VINAIVAIVIIGRSIKGCKLGKILKDRDTISPEAEIAWITNSITRWAIDCAVDGYAAGGSC
jgi:hypothetical protein